MAQRVRALYEFVAEDPTELGFQAGELITLVPLEDDDPEWLFGHIGDREGAFPISFVEYLDEYEAALLEEDNELPIGWSCALDKATGLVYYFNEEGKTTWDRPEPPVKMLGRTQRNGDIKLQLGQTSRPSLKEESGGRHSGRLEATTDYGDEGFYDDDDKALATTRKSNMGGSRSLGTTLKRSQTLRKPGTASGSRGGGGDTGDSMDLKTARRQLTGGIQGSNGRSQQLQPQGSGGNLGMGMKKQATVRSKTLAMYEAEGFEDDRDDPRPHEQVEWRRKPNLGTSGKGGRMGSSRTHSLRRRHGPSDEEVEALRQRIAARRIQRAYHTSPLAASRNRRTSTGGRSGKGSSGTLTRGQTLKRSPPPPPSPSEEEIERLRQDIAAKRIQRAYRSNSFKIKDKQQLSRPVPVRQATLKRGATQRVPMPTQRQESVQRLPVSGPNGNALIANTRRLEEQRHMQMQQARTMSQLRRSEQDEEEEDEEEEERRRRAYMQGRMRAEKRARMHRLVRAAVRIQVSFRKWRARARHRIVAQRRRGQETGMGGTQTRPRVISQMSAAQGRTQGRGGLAPPQQPPVRQPFRLPPPMGQDSGQRRRPYPQPAEEEDDEWVVEDEGEDGLEDDEDEDERMQYRRPSAKDMQTPKNYIDPRLRGGSGNGHQKSQGRVQRRMAPVVEGSQAMVPAGYAGAGAKRLPPLPIDDYLMEAINSIVEEKVAREFARHGLTCPPSAPQQSIKTLLAPPERPPVATLQLSPRSQQAATRNLSPKLNGQQTPPSMAGVLPHAPAATAALAKPDAPLEPSMSVLLDGSRADNPSMRQSNHGRTHKRGQSGGTILEGRHAVPKLYKECRSAVYAPTGVDPGCVTRDPPDTQLSLEHVYGYNGDFLRFGGQERFGCNIVWLRTGEIAFPASATVVMFNTELNHQRFFSGHDDDVMTLCRHPSSDILASGQAGPRPSRVCVYDASGKDVEPISTFLPSTTAKGICGLDFSPDGELLVVVLDEDSYYKVSVWDWRKACLLTQMLCKVSRFHSIRFNPYCYVSLKKARLESNVMYTLVSGACKQIKFWTLSMEREQVTNSSVSGAGSNVSCATRDKDGRLVFRRVKGERGYVYRLEANSGMFRRGVELQDALCVCFVKEPDAKKTRGGGRVYTLTGTDKGAIHVWVQLESMDGTDPAETEASDRGDDPDRIRGWLAKGKLVSVVPDAHEGAVTAICYTKEQHMIVSCGKDGLINCWVPSKPPQGNGAGGIKDAARSSSPLQNVRALQLLGSIPGVGVPRAVAWSAEANCWVVGTTGCAVCLLRRRTGGKPLGSSARAAQSGRNNTVPESDSGLHVTPVIRGHTGAVKAVVEHPSLPAFATVGADKTLRVWDSVTKKLVYINRLWDRGTALSFHPHGHLLAVGTEEGEVIVLECARSGHVTAKRKEEDLPLRLDEWKVVARRGVALGSTHDSHSLSQSQSRRGGDSTSTLHGLKPKSDVCVLRWSPDGQVLAVACRDKLVHLFGKEFHYRRLGSCRGHSTAVVRMDFSADGRVLQTNDMGREMLFWDVETAKQLRNPSSTRDVPWSSWTCMYGWPVQGIWDTATTDPKDLGPPSLCRSHDGTTLAVGDHRRLRLLRYPCLKGAAARVTPAHATCVLGLAFLRSDARLISVGGADLCVFQWRHTPAAEPPPSYVPASSLSSSTAAALRNTHAHGPTQSLTPPAGIAYPRHPAIAIHTSAASLSDEPYVRTPSRAGVLSPTAASTARRRSVQFPDPHPHQHIPDKKAFNLTL